MSRLNPLTKLFSLILSNVMLFIHVNEMTEAIMSLLFLLPFFLSDKVKTGVKMAILYYGLLAVDMLLIPRLNGRISVLISLAAISLRMMLPCIIAGAYAFSTTTIGEFVCALRKIRVPESIIIPCMVIIRFFPTIREDYIQIRNAMAFRGIASGKGAILLHPIQSLEYILIPLLMNGNNVAQDLSVSSLTKGIGLSGKHTCMTEITMKIWDWLYMILCTMPLILFWKGVL